MLSIAGILCVFIANSQSLQVIVEPFFKGCKGDSVHLEVSAVTGYSGQVSLKWFRDDGVEFLQPEIDVIVNETRHYCAVAEDASGFIDTACTELSAHPHIPSSFHIDDPQGCEPWFVLMTSDFIQYQDVETMTWFFGDGESTTSMASANHEYANDGVYYPSLLITDHYGCEYTDTISSPVVIWPSPDAEFSCPISLNLPESSVDISNESTDAEYYTWIVNGHSSEATGDTLIQFPPIAASHWVSLVTSNQYGCTDSEQKQITIRDEIDIYIPNAFTPDEDGRNDVWKIEGMGFRPETFTVSVLNNWGEVLFETDDPLLAWTGNYNNGTSFVPDGTYYYHVKVMDNRNDVWHVFDGAITILR